MSVTLEQVRAHLNPDEPDYHAAAKLGPDAVPHLMGLVQSGDQTIAPKAAYLASLIPSAGSLAVLEAAARSNDPVVRVAAAGALPNLKAVPDPLVDLFLNDSDFGVRKVTLESIAALRIPNVKTKLQRIAKQDSQVLLRQLASQILGRLP
jgi:HEAT repeat protein